ncbi:uncharacterized protein EHS24_003790 [Apiotrichum porosum]|uniref:Choline/carnitine acyltransferase domain-containing protein n=1 Tax=Apiotrichum porosum TaxID=105984 RepID=A0A427XE75_9TREE|nr:uncharacterized protein EHS24_003790 [Apiotrichum porosum]RSH77156.1 hypothetical protein EHS24_003790 [Apiotrichum porosum]
MLRQIARSSVSTLVSSQPYASVLVPRMVAVATPFSHIARPYSASTHVHAARAPRRPHRLVHAPAVRGLHASPEPSTFSLQSQVPRLPIPSLEDTAARYLKSLEPLLSAHEYQRSEKAVADFIGKDGMGPVLQARLQEVDKNAPYSWLEDIWLNKAYLEWRGSCYINVNWGATIGDNANLPVLRDVPADKVTVIQLDRAARVIYHMLEANDAINDNTMPVDQVKGKPLDMDQFKWQFGTTRIPKPVRDELKYQYPSTARHILVMYRGVAVEVPVYSPSGERASTAQIAAQLELATQRVDYALTKKGPAPSVAQLTAADRDLWSTARESLSKDNTNRASLTSVEDALFGVCLDVLPEGVDPATLLDPAANWAEYAHNGDGSNRWFDKAIELVFLPNGRMGACCEHTPVDALTTGRLLLETLAKEANPVPDTEPIVAGLEAPKPLKWNLTPDVVTAIGKAKDEAKTMASDLRLVFGDVPDFGAKWIKSLGVGPDAFFQVAVQLAHLRQHGRPVATYESASLRRFLHGRTETIRSCTSDALKFAMAFDDKDVDVARKLELFKTAAATQSALTAAAAAGQGVDRHLLGLRAQLQSPEEAEKASLFADPAYARSTSFVLSTSNTTPGDKFRGGFAPVVADGYGVNYALDPKDIKIQVSDWVSSKSTDAPRFLDTVVQTLRDIHAAGQQITAAR